MSGGFGAGFVKGMLVSGIAAAAISLALPMDPVDPKRKTQVDLNTPTGSGFNSERADTNPVLPDTDQAVSEGVKETAPRPEGAAPEPRAPAADTTPAGQPEPGAVAGLPEIGDQGGELALMTPEGDTPPATPGAGPPAAPPALGLPMPEIDDPVTEIPVNQLPIVNAPATEVETPPAIADDGQPADPASSAPAADPAPVLREDIIDTALMRNRVGHSNPAGKPLMAVVLIYAGEEGLDLDVLRTFGFPVSFAIDPDMEGATAAAKRLRADGFEVLALAPKEPGAGGGVSQLFARLPEAVALIDRPTAALQRDAALSESVIAELAASGHGLLTYDIGLNTTDKKARREGLFADTVFRVLDGERESGTVIKRYLDRAVLEAGKTGRVIVLGRSYPETVTALFSWALGPKSAAVSLAPVSAVLLAR